MKAWRAKLPPPPCAESIILSRSRTGKEIFRPIRDWTGDCRIGGIFFRRRTGFANCAEPAETECGKCHSGDKNLRRRKRGTLPGPAELVRLLKKLVPARCFRRISATGAGICCSVCWKHSSVTARGGMFPPHFTALCCLRLIL